MRQVRMLLGISIFWLGLSMLADGLTTLVLPDRQSGPAVPVGRTTAERAGDLQVDVDGLSVQALLPLDVLQAFLE